MAVSRCVRGRGRATVGSSDLQQQTEQVQPEPPRSSKTAIGQCNSRLATSRIRAAGFNMDGCIRAGKFFLALHSRSCMMRVRTLNCLSAAKEYV
eukprot:908539-Pelagomonas_calceolata.AAC.1